MPHDLFPPSTVVFCNRVSLSMEFVMHVKVGQMMTIKSLELLPPGLKKHLRHKQKVTKYNVQTKK